MVELYDGLMTTRSMRRFTDEPVTDEEIERILAAAVQAPSGGNIQPYQFLVVTDADRRRRSATCTGGPTTATSRRCSR